MPGDNDCCTQLVFSKVKTNLGLDQTRLFLTSAAPITVEVRNALETKWLAKPIYILYQYVWLCGTVHPRYNNITLCFYRARSICLRANQWVHIIHSESCVVLLAVTNVFFFPLTLTFVYGISKCRYLVASRRLLFELTCLLYTRRSRARGKIYLSVTPCGHRLLLRLLTIRLLL